MCIQTKSDSSLSGPFQVPDMSMSGRCCCCCCINRERERREGCEAPGKATIQLSIFLQSWQSRGSIKARCLALIFWPSPVMIRSPPDQNDGAVQTESGSRWKQRKCDELWVDNSSPHTDVVLFWAPLSCFVFNLLCPRFTLTSPAETEVGRTLGHERK